MVSVDKTTTEYILQDIYSALITQLKTISTESIESAFSCWLYPSGLSSITPVLPTDFSVTNYSHVAQLGYLITISPEIFSKFDSELTDGLIRTLGRPTASLSTGKAPFCNDAIALLGLSLGACYLSGDTLKAMKEWLSGFIDLSNPSLPEWKKMLMQAALWNTDHNAKFHLEYSIHLNDLQLALASKGINCFTNVDFDNVYRSIFKGSLEQQVDTYLIASKLQAINYITNHLPVISLSRPNVEQVKNVLTNLTSAFKRWIWEEKGKTSTSTAQKWDIQNEYHVQSLLYFVLASLFPDIESEFYLENIGQLNSRADIGLPSLNLIIEVKFLRKNKSFQDMIEEVAADNSLYFKMNSVFKDKYKQMLVFLWDDSNRDHEHGTFIKGVQALNNVIGCVVIPRPGIIRPKPDRLLE